MQRYFIQDQQIHNNLAIITDQDAHHIKNVMRLKPGDALIVVSYSGKTYEAKIKEFTKKDVILTLGNEQIVLDNTLNLTIAQALIKKDAFELVLQKTTELGAKGIIPLSTNHSIVKIDDFAKKKTRYETIVKEASEQSERNRMPIIHDICNIETLPYQDYDTIFIAYAREESQTLKAAMENLPKTKNTLVLIGPEGGFSPSEIQFLQTRGTIVTLGNTILRSETAAIYVMSVFRHVWGN
ncbi:MAG: 16S rRNA (uracil(1498)-N(3))-methyltransferase [Bacilli bacterium]|nr:16S rRNA (uracil(1498)-N(3))-methyltransferase [Bacilli bacterium]MBN2877923.1 16S rRNA (uracil(1498)-N(3))-methyltransferase [Bacilli bacterium]